MKILCLLNIDLIISTMFFGKILKQGERYQFNAQNADEFQGEVLSITNAVLTPSSKESASLFINKDSQEFLIATLTKESPQISLNIFISLLDELEIYVKGNAAVHITGFFQPEQDDDYEDIEEEEALKEAPKVIPGKIQTVKVAEAKPSAPQKKPENQVAAKAPEPKPQSHQQKSQPLPQQKSQSPQQKPQSPQQKPQSPQQKPQSPQQKPQSPQQKPQSPQQKPQPVEVKKTAASLKVNQVVAPVLNQQESDSEDFVLDEREENIDDSIDEENHDSLKKKQKNDHQSHKPVVAQQKTEQKGLKITNLEEKKHNQTEVKKQNGNEHKHENVSNTPNTQHLSKKQLKKLKKEMKNKQQK